MHRMPEDSRCGRIEMKIEIISGIHRNKSTKKIKLPLPENTRVKLDGKDISENIDFIHFYMDVGSIPQWSLGMKGNKPQFKFFIKRNYYKLRFWIRGLFREF